MSSAFTAPSPPGLRVRNRLAAHTTHDRRSAIIHGMASGLADVDGPGRIETPSPPPRLIPASLASVVERCRQHAAIPPEWRLTRGQFQAALERSVAHRFAAGVSVNHSGIQTDERTIENYLDTLHVSDLALACACSVGSAAAWECFIAQFRPELYRAARAICGPSMGDAAARDLADSLYADLYGLKERGGVRKSLFDYFHGRSKLSTWLRAVLAQRRVDEVRRARRMESLEDDEDGKNGETAASEAGRALRFEPSAALDPGRAKYLAILQTVLAAALGTLAPGDRLRLAYYYVDELTLAQIGRVLGEHEATVSRKLDRTRREVRKRVERALRDEKGLTAEQIGLCLEHARGEWPFDLTQNLRAASSQIDPPGEAGALSED
jgi:RNA polymerase sigma-70 factor, ECF subfamily